MRGRGPSQASPASAARYRSFLRRRLHAQEFPPNPRCDHPVLDLADHAEALPKLKAAPHERKRPRTAGQSSRARVVKRGPSKSLSSSPSGTPRFGENGPNGFGGGGGGGGGAVIPGAAPEVPLNRIRSLPTRKSFAAAGFRSPSSILRFQWANNFQDLVIASCFLTGHELDPGAQTMVKDGRETSRLIADGDLRNLLDPRPHTEPTKPSAGNLRSYLPRSYRGRCSFWSNG